MFSVSRIRNTNRYHQCNCGSELNKASECIESPDSGSKEEMNSTGITLYFPTKIGAPGNELLPSLSFHLYSTREVPGSTAASRVSKQPVGLCPSVAIKLLQLSISQNDPDRADRLSLTHHQRGVAMAISCCQVAHN